METKLLKIHESVRELRKLRSDKEKYLKLLESKLSKSYRIKDEKTKTMIRIQATILSAIREYLDSKGFVEILPPIIGPASDPGIRGARQAVIDFYGRPYKVMSSAILYKQMMATALKKIYFVSPNIRLEPLETIYTGRHLVEFFQVDIEWARATYFQVMSLAEGLLNHVIKRVTEEHQKTLEELFHRSLSIFPTPFKKYSYIEVLKILEDLGIEAKYGEEISWECEELISALHDRPFFIIDYPLGSRGFYDLEDPERPGILRDFDMLYPEGFGEAISGAEREYQYHRVAKRMLDSGEKLEEYSWYLNMLKEGIEPSAGFGIGVERLTRFICGLRAVWEARPYPKVAGLFSP